MRKQGGAASSLRRVLEACLAQRLSLKMGLTSREHDGADILPVVGADQTSLTIQKGGYIGLHMRP